MSYWAPGEHLVRIYDALYSSMAEVASQARDATCVVRLHEASREFGYLALELRGDGHVDADPLVATLVRRSLADDETGALTLFALALLVGPRLLVSLRDYLDVEDDPGCRALLSHGSDVVVREVLATGRVMTAHEDPRRASAAQELRAVLDGAGMAESLGQHR